MKLAVGVKLAVGAVGVLFAEQMGGDPLFFFFFVTEERNPMLLKI